MNIGKSYMPELKLLILGKTYLHSMLMLPKGLCYFIKIEEVLCLRKSLVMMALLRSP